MKRNAVLFGVLTVGLVLLFGLDVCSGSIWLWPFGELSLMEHQIMHSIRLPKAITAILAGGALSVSGLMMQTLFRNPLAGPYTLGVSSGASLGCESTSEEQRQSVDRRYDVWFNSGSVGESAAELRQSGCVEVIYCVDVRKPK